MTNLEALRMVRRADSFALAAVAQMTTHRTYGKAAKAAMNTFFHAERALEFEVGFEDMKQEYQVRELENVDMANKLLNRIGRGIAL